MNVVVGDMASPPAPTFLTQSFRPFFLAAGLWSAASLALWIVMFATGSAVPSRFDPLAWHIHEMLFGFVMAAVAGFLLTAIPNWTKRPSVSGFPLAVLAGLWLLGRVACLISALVPAWLAIAADLSFPVALVGLVTREIVAGRNWRNLPMVAPVTVLGIANLLMHLEADGVTVPLGLGWRLGLAAVIVLISVVAGRIVPSFTRNWLAKRGDPGLPAVHGWIDRAALGILHAGLSGWAFFPAFRAVGVLLLLGAALNLWRLLRWHGAATGDRHHDQGFVRPGRAGHRHSDRVEVREWPGVVPVSKRHMRARAGCGDLHVDDMTALPRPIAARPALPASA
jgi:uncharacterized protein involved in response to NO